MFVLSDLIRHPFLIEEVLWLMWNEWNEEYAFFGITTFELFMKEHKTIGINLDDFIIALGDEEELVGFTSILESDLGFTFPKGRFLANLYVKEHCRGRGIGTAMIRKCIGIVNAIELNLYLWTYTEQLAQWYEQFGFRVIDSKRNCLSHDVIYVMQY